MNSDEALDELQRYLAPYRIRNYSDLADLIDSAPETVQVVGTSGAKYQIEVSAMWDDEPNGVLRIRGTIDDGGLRALVPLVSDFLIAPNGAIVGE